MIAIHKNLSESRLLLLDKYEYNIYFQDCFHSVEAVNMQKLQVHLNGIWICRTKSFVSLKYISFRYLRMYFNFLYSANFSFIDNYKNRFTLFPGTVNLIHIVISWKWTIQNFRNQFINFIELHIFLNFFFFIYTEIYLALFVACSSFFTASVYKPHAFDGKLEINSNVFKTPLL